MLSMDLHLLDNRLSLVKGSMYVAMESSNLCTGKALPPGHFDVRRPQQECILAEKHSASSQTIKGVTY